MSSRNELGSQQEKEFDELQLSITETETEGLLLSFPLKLLTSAATPSSLEKSRSSSTMKCSPPPQPPSVSLSEEEWRVSATNWDEQYAALLI